MLKTIVKITHIFKVFRIKKNLIMILKKIYILKIYFLIIFISLISFNSFSQQSDKKFTVVLDAGHGGKDPGNRGNNYYEKKIALKIALTTGDILKRKSDINIIYTRKKDVFIGLIKRAEIANKADADLFVSIHCDAHNSNAYGAGSFVLGLHANQRNFEIAKKENNVIFYEENYEQKYDGFDPNNPESVISLTLMQETYLDQSIKAADAIQKSFKNNLKRKDRSVKQAGFIVLKYTYMPSVLVEAGFLTNKREGAYLNSSKGQKEISAAIADGILNYLSSLKVSLNQNDSYQQVDLENKNEEIYFRIQLAASSKSLEPKSYNFKGLNPIFKEKEGKLYRYYFGKFNSYSDAKKMKRKAARSGFKSAFIVSFSGDKKVKLSSVID